jgi:hypothetical protein
MMLANDWHTHNIVIAEAIRSEKKNNILTVYKTIKFIEEDSGKGDRYDSFIRQIEN